MSTGLLTPTPTRRSALRAGGAGLASLLGVLPRKSLAAPALGGPPTAAYPQMWDAPRVIRLRNTDTGQSGEFTYWENGDFVMSAYYAISAMMLDWREHKAVQLAPRALDAIYASQTWYALAERKTTYTECSSGYRTPRTNAMVGGSPGSLHLKGEALDGKLVGVSLKTYAAMLLNLQVGGVGLYDTHVHWDSGARRFWRSRRES